MTTPKHRASWSRRRQMRLLRTGAALAVILALVGWLALRGTGQGARTVTQPPKTASGSQGPANHSSANSEGRGQNQDHTTVATGFLGDGQPVTLAFGGDIHFEGPLAARLASDPATALGPVSTLMAGSDLAMANFESALTDGGCPQPQAKQFVFHAPPSALTAIRDAGLTVVTEANNHGEDCGPGGLQQSLAIAAASHFPVIGVGNDVTQAFSPFRATIHGQRVAIIAATQVLDTNLKQAWTATDNQGGLASAYDEDHLLAAVRAARATSDTVVVYLHWGTETRTCPNALQPPLAQDLVAAGADILVGAHAHVQLGAGYLGRGFVDYGLGNLAFYDSAPPESYSGVLFVTVTGRHVDSYQWHPASLSGALPYRLNGAAAASAVSRWASLRGCAGLSPTPSS